MLRHHSAVLLVAWALWGMPTLCVGGVLEHLCVEGREHCEPAGSSGGSHEEPAHPLDDGCGHESDCGLDPCAASLTRAERLIEDLPTLTWLPVVLPPLRDATIEGCSFRLSPPHIVIIEFRLPVHPSDLPLLI